MNMPSEDLITFADRLMEDKGLVGLDDAVRAQVQNDLVSRMEDRINAAIIANLPKDELPAFSSILETGTETDIRTFCADRIKGLDDIVARELLAFRQTYLAG